MLVIPQIARTYLWKALPELSPVKTTTLSSQPITGMVITIL